MINQQYKIISKITQKSEFSNQMFDDYEIELNDEMYLNFHIKTIGSVSIEKGEVLDFIVQKAIEFKLGARGLRSICEAILNDAMFELPSKNFLPVTESALKKQCELINKNNEKQNITLFINLI